MYQLNEKWGAFQIAWASIPRLRYLTRQSKAIKEGLCLKFSLVSMMYEREKVSRAVTESFRLRVHWAKKTLYAKIAPWRRNAFRLDQPVCFLRHPMFRKCYRNVRRAPKILPHAAKTSGRVVLRDFSLALRQAHLLGAQTLALIQGTCCFGSCLICLYSPKSQMRNP